MKKLILTIIVFSMMVMHSFAQDSDMVRKDTRIPLIGENAPSFSAETTKGKLNFPDDYFGKWKILFSHPAAFTAVCSSELLELANMQDAFEKLGTKLVVMSTDGLSSHIEWVKSLETINYKDHGFIKINFPLVSDPNLEISRKYGMIHSFSSTTKDIRGVFIIDGNNKIKALFFYPMNVGRSTDEILRTLKALQASEDKNYLMPANWEPGQDVLLRSPRTTEDAEKLAKKNDPDLYQLNWYMWFKRMK
jgi:peroxiredoxin 2/4